LVLGGDGAQCIALLLVLSRWSQCNIACAELSLTTCCDAAVADACNVSWWLAKALQRTQNF